VSEIRIRELRRSPFGTGGRKTKSEERKEVARLRGVRPAVGGLPRWWRMARLSGLAEEKR